MINARFVKPLEPKRVLQAVEACRWCSRSRKLLEGGFGSAVLEAANEAGLDTANDSRLGMPDRYIEHGERGELLADLGLDPPGIISVCRKAAARCETHAVRAGQA